VSVAPGTIIREEILAMKAYAVPAARDLVKLDAMENPYGLPEALRSEIGDAVARAQFNRYPDPTAPALLERLRKAMGIGAEYAVLLGNGSDEIIHIVLQSVARPGAVVLAPRPSFVMFDVYARLAGVRYVGLPVRADFTLDAEAFLRALAEHRPAVVFIAYPNNPTGNLFDEVAIESIIAAAPGLVVIDEAYHAFARKTFIGSLARFPNLVIMRTLSKLGLAGIRLGYALGRPEWIREFDKVRPPYNVNVLTQIAAERVLAHGAVLESQARSVVAERQILDARLKELPGVTVFPSEANFILVRVADAPRTFEGMLRRGVLVKSLHGTDAALDQCLRITVGTPDENRQCVGALAAALAEALRAC
jgi:histidinol-phosphate aminotransferase